ncbi:MAG: hypothetical protein IT304_04395 [Dehalococcoidia bacterium]|nr:hypothetical protein [Dehalococcoidia bacterium]
MSLEFQPVNVIRRGGAFVATIRVLEDGELIVADTVRLNDAAARRSFHEDVLARCRSAAPDLADTEQKLLNLFDHAIEEQDADKSGARPASTATQLIELALDAGCIPFHTPDGRAYVTLPVGSHHEHWPLSSQSVRRWLQRRYYDGHTKVPGAQAVADALGVLEGRAFFDGPCHPVFTRIGEHQGDLYLDLADDAWHTVRITAGGWQVVANAPVRFRRTRGMLALPVPLPGGDLDALRPFVNVANDDGFRLLVAWLLGALQPRGPYPVLALHGEQGSAKSTTARILRSLVDPSVAPLRRPPRDERDLAIAATNCWVVAYDNLSHLPPWLSDALCCLSTGGGYTTRALFTDDEEVLLDLQRPALLTGIEELTTRDDLADRALVLTLPAIADEARQDEHGVWQRFEALRPVLLGALLSSASAALGRRSTVLLDRRPRLADFAIWVTAAEPALAWQPGAFLTAYASSRDDALASTIEASPIAAHVIAFVDEHDGSWSGTPSELFAALAGRLGDRPPRIWPRSASALGNALVRLAPALRRNGLDVQRSRSGRRRSITIRTATPPPVIPVTTVTPAPTGPLHGSISSDGDAPHRDTNELEAATPSPTPVSVRASERQYDGGDGGDRPSLDCLLELDVAGAAVQVVRLTDAATLTAALPALFAAEMIGLDTETTGLDARHHRLRLIQLAIPGRVFIVDTDRVPLDGLAPLLRAARCITGHHLQFDLAFLAAAGLPVPHGDRLFDTFLAAQLLRAGTDEGRWQQCSLARVVRRTLGISLNKEAQTSDWSAALTDARVRYAALDAAVILPLAERLRDELAEADLGRVAAIEMRALPAVVWLQGAGAPVDIERWAALSDGALAAQLGIERELTEQSATADLLGAPTVSWSSPEQVRRLLRRRGLEVATTDEATLLAVADRDHLVPLLLAYREAARRASAYGIDFLTRYVADGRVYGGYHQIGAATGRMSSDKPNLQNLPRERAYRACIRPPEGRCLVKADYSQIELRIAAALTRDERMLAAYARGEDLHTVTAAGVLSIPVDEVGSTQRQAAKAINFGLTFGMGHQRLRDSAARDYGVTLTDAEARAYRERFFATYPGIRRWQRDQVEGAIDTRTLAGRRRLAVESFTEKLNSPVQGTGADGLKLALALLWERRHDCPSAVPVLAVHDEIVVECDVADARRAAEWLTAAMRDGMSQLLADVPVAIDVTICRDWSGAPLDQEGAE